MFWREQCNTDTTRSFLIGFKCVVFNLEITSECDSLIPTVDQTPNQTFKGRFMSGEIQPSHFGVVWNNTVL